MENETETQREINFKKIKITRKDALHFLKTLLILTVLAFIRALGSYVFIFPNGFAPGGINGVASIIYNAVLPSNPQLAETVFNPAVTAFVLNIPLFIASFFVLDKKFAFNTFLAVTIHSLWMGLFSLVDFPVFKATDTESALNLLAAAGGGAAGGICLGFILRHNSCMGGTDIIGKIIYKYNPVADVQWLILGCDMVVVLASGCLGFIGLSTDASPTTIMTSILSPILYSALAMIINAEIADIIQSGLQSSLVFNIISDKHDEIATQITVKTHRGVTLVKAVGFYTNIEHDMLICVARKKQINQIKAIILECDPGAFIYITKAREVTGKGFTYHTAG